MKPDRHADKVKEAVFSAVNAYIYDCEFLDVFGGTGAMALEAVSRGAKEAVILEKDRDAQKTIIDNIALCGFAKKCVLLKGDSLQNLEKIGREKRQMCWKKLPQEIYSKKKGLF